MGKEMLPFFYCLFACFSCLLFLLLFVCFIVSLFVFQTVLHTSQDLSSPTRDCTQGPRQ